MSFHFLFILASFISKVFQKKLGNERTWNEVNDEEKKANEANDPIHNLQYIYQYKIQYTIPNTVTKTKSIPHKRSPHNRIKNLITYLNCLGRGVINVPIWFPTSQWCCQCLHPFPLYNFVS